ncbi:hypothetical protein FOZ63_000587, partial [Perkinsus olseni]
MLTNAPVASRVAVADQIYGRSRRQKAQPAKGFLNRNSSMEDCNVELDVIPDGDFVAAGRGHSVDDRSVEPELSAPTAAGLEWRFGEDFDQDDPPYDTSEEPPMADAIMGDVPYDERLGLSHDVYSTKLAGHLHQAKPRLFLPEASVDRRIVSVGSPTDDDWFDCHHERVSMAAKLLDEATRSLLDPLDTGVLLNRAEASLMNKAMSKSKLLGMCSHRRRALLRELPQTIAQRRSKLSSKGPVVVVVVRSTCCCVFDESTEKGRVVSSSSTPSLVLCELTYCALDEALICRPIRKLAIDSGADLYTGPGIDPELEDLPLLLEKGQSGCCTVGGEVSMHHLLIGLLYSGPTDCPRCGSGLPPRDESPQMTGQGDPHVLLGAKLLSGIRLPLSFAFQESSSSDQKSVPQQPGTWGGSPGVTR